MTNGTCNGGDRGNVNDRRARREWLVKTYRADVDFLRITYSDGLVIIPDVRDENTVEMMMSAPDVVSSVTIPACRCYRCGCLLTAETVSPDRIIPGCVKTAEYPNGGTYARKNLRPACIRCQSITGNQIKAELKKKAVRV